MKSEALSKRLVCWDFEGAGDTPLQVGIATLESGQIVPRFFSDLYCHREEFIPWQNPVSHADRDRFVKAPTLTSLWPQLGQFWECDAFVSHAHGTENKYLGCLAFHPARPWLDTLRLMRFAYPRLNSYKLGNLLRELGSYNEAVQIASTFLPEACEEHHPIFDVVGALLLVRHLTTQTALQNLTIANLLRIRPKDYYQENHASQKQRNRSGLPQKSELLP